MHTLIGFCTLFLSSGCSFGQLQCHVDAGFVLVTVFLEPPPRRISKAACLSDRPSNALRTRRVRTFLSVILTLVDGKWGFTGPRVKSTTYVQIYPISH